MSLSMPFTSVSFTVITLSNTERYVRTNAAMLKYL